MRFKEHNVLNVSLNDMVRNLVPYSRLHTVLSSYSPYRSSQTKLLDLNSVAFDLFDNDCLSTSVDLAASYYMSSVALFRGASINASEIISSINQARNQSHVKFTDWCPTGLKVGINQKTDFDF